MFEDISLAEQLEELMRDGIVDTEQVTRHTPVNIVGADLIRIERRMLVFAHAQKAEAVVIDSFTSVCTQQFGRLWAQEPEEPEPFPKGTPMHQHRNRPQQPDPRKYRGRR
jgi:hypothetical protein